MASVYRPVNDIIDSLWSQAKEDDDFLSNTPRWRIQKVVREGAIEFIEKYTSQTKSLRMPVGSTNSVKLPEDFTKMLGVSEFTECGKLIPIPHDPSIMSTVQQLLDDNNRVLLDNNNVPLLGSGDDGISRDCYSYDYGNCMDYSSYRMYSSYYSNYWSLSRYYDINPSFAQGVHYMVDVNQNRVQLSGRNVEEVVIDYMYDPSKNVGNMSQLEMHRYFFQALKNYAYYNLIATKRSVPQNEKFRAQKTYEKSLIEARIHKSSPSYQMLKYATKLK